MQIYYLCTGCSLHSCAVLLCGHVNWEKIHILVGYRSTFASEAPFLSGPSLGMNQQVNVYMLPLDLCDRYFLPIKNLFLITSSMQIMMGYE